MWRGPSTSFSRSSRTRASILTFVSPSSTTVEALRQVETWLAAPSLVMMSEVAEHFRDLERAVNTGRVTGPRVHDARVAALLRGARDSRALDGRSRFRAVSCAARSQSAGDLTLHYARRV